MKNEDAESQEARLRIQLFGAFDVRIDGVPIPPLRTRKVQWLLALLVLRHGQALDRAWLAGTLWPESAPSQALYNLRQGLSNLRHALGETFLSSHVSTVNALSLDVSHANIDVLTFDASIAAGDSEALERAAALYRGPLLEGCAEEWVFSERRVREENYLSALESLAAGALSRGEGSAAVPYLRAVIQTDPFREQAQRALISALTGIGDYGAAVQVYRELRLLLHRELNTEPDPETQALFQQIREEARQAASVRPAVPTPSLSVPTRQLPTPLTALVGRQSEVEQIVTTFRASRLLTLTGPGGVGKTRLAIAVAETLVDAYSDGVFFVDLAPLSDPALIAQTVVATLKVREEPNRPPILTLREYLPSKSLLLVLDNCEHLLDGCANLTEEILRHGPRVSVLATSREALGLTGEVKWRVPPLATPPISGQGFQDRKSHKEWVSLLSEYEAVQLFVARAQQAQPTFQMSAHNAEAIAQICAHLDGMPLALELAAARVRSLTVDEINARLDHRFRLLTGGSRAALPRQQTLRALMDWSYDLLNAREKALLCCLAVFAGGWTLEAAEQVCAAAVPKADPGKGCAEEEALEAWEVLDLLTSLVDKSLVMVEQAGASRYQLLETVRQYAQERLAESGEADLWRTAHRDYFQRMAKEAQVKVAGAEQVLWLQRLKAEHDNLRAAMDFCLESPGGAKAGLQMAGDLQQFWYTHGHFSEGRARLETFLARTDTQELSPERAHALNGVGSMAWMQGDYAVAHTFYTKSLQLGRELNDSRIIGGTLSNLGSIANMQGDYAAARAYFEESLAIKRDIGDNAGIANTLIGLGNMALEQGDYATARSLSEQSLALGQELQDKRSMARSFINLGNVALKEDDYAAARSYYESSLAIQREMEDRRGMARSLNNLGNLAMEQGDYAAAHPLIEESVSIHRELGDKPGVSHSLCTLGALLVKRGDYSAAHGCLNECLALCVAIGERWVATYVLESCAELADRQHQEARAARLYSTADAVRTAIGAPLSSRTVEEQERALAALQERLGAEAFAAAWAEGQAMPLEEVRLSP